MIGHFMKFSVDLAEVTSLFMHWI